MQRKNAKREERQKKWKKLGVFVGQDNPTKGGKQCQNGGKMNNDTSWAGEAAAKLHDEKKS